MTDHTLPPEVEEALDNLLTMARYIDGVAGKQVAALWVMHIVAQLATQAAEIERLTVKVEEGPCKESDHRDCEVLVINKQHMAERDHYKAMQDDWKAEAYRRLYIDKAAEEATRE